MNLLQLSASNETYFSLFDSDDDKKEKDNKFKFFKPKNTHQNHFKATPVITGSLRYQDLTSKRSKESAFALYGDFLVKIQTKKTGFFSSKQGQDKFRKVLDIKFSRLKTLPLSENKAEYGFILTKNGNSFVFYCENKAMLEKWMVPLKTTCVLTSLRDDYKTLKLIGKGSFAKVYLIQSIMSGEHYAVKAFTKEPNNSLVKSKQKQRKALMNEIDMMRSLNHENIIKLFEVHETEKSVFFVMEMVNGKSLEDIFEDSSYLTHSPKERVTTITSSILKALSYMASQGMMHRDLKPENILVDNSTGKVKIIDLGFAARINEGQFIYKRCGSPGFIAPEIFDYDSHKLSTFYNDRVDVFSAGCILYSMLFGLPLYNGKSTSTILRLNEGKTSILKCQDDIVEELGKPDSKINKEGLKLLQRMLELNKNKRISAKDALKHPYFQPIAQSLTPSPNSQDLVCKTLDLGDYFSPFPAHHSEIAISISSLGGLSPLTPNRTNNLEKNRLNFGAHCSPDDSPKSDSFPGKSIASSLFSQSQSKSGTSTNSNSDQGFTNSESLSPVNRRPHRKSCVSPRKSAKRDSVLKAAIFCNINGKNPNDASGNPFKLISPRRRFSAFLPGQMSDWDISTGDDPNLSSSICIEGEVGDAGEEGCSIKANFVKIGGWKIKKRAAKK